MNKKSSISNIVGNFNEACKLYNVSITLLFVHKNIEEYENKLRTAAQIGLSTLEWLFKEHLEAEKYELIQQDDNDWKKLIQRPHFNILIQLMKKYADPAFDKTGLNGEDFSRISRSIRNFVTHNATGFPSNIDVYEALLKVRELILTYLPKINENELENIKPLPEIVEELFKQTKHKKENRFLDAAIPEIVFVNQQTELITMIRLPESEGLQAILKNNFHFQARSEDVQSKSFGVAFPLDERGNATFLDLWISVETSDFNIIEQRKKIRIEPAKDSEYCAFLLTPKKSGELRLLVQVHVSETLLATGLLKINGRTTFKEGFNAIKRLISLPLGVFSTRSKPQPIVPGYDKSNWHHKSMPRMSHKIPDVIKWKEVERIFQEGIIVEGRVMNVHRIGVFVSVCNDFTGLIHRKYLEDDYEQQFFEGQRIKVKIIKLTERKQIELRFCGKFKA